VNIRITVLFFLLFVAANGTVFSREAGIVTIIPVTPVVVAKGQTTLVTIKAKIKKGFHIQANPAADEFLIPTTLTVQAAEGIVPGKPVYPPGVPYQLKGSSKNLLTYEDEVTIRVPVTVMESAPVGNTNLTGELRFQPCDDRKCLFPRSIPLQVPVTIVAPQNHNEKR